MQVQIKKQEAANKAAVFTVRYVQKANWISIKYSFIDLISVWAKNVTLFAH